MAAALMSPLWTAREMASGSKGGPERDWGIPPRVRAIKHWTGGGMFVWVGGGLGGGGAFIGCGGLHLDGGRERVGAYREAGRGGRGFSTQQDFWEACEK
jgi:hypothetical protein